VIVVDASALVAIGDLEPEAELFASVIAHASRAVASPANIVEAGLVLIGRDRFDDIGQFNIWLADLGVETSPDRIDPAVVLASYFQFGRGYHRARLNFADCFAYALAKALDAPLLYKGDDFSRTDVRSAMA
jgi:ribonuclease VapC